MQSSSEPDQPLPAKDSESGSDPFSTFRVGQRVHWAGDTRRIGTVKYIGALEGHPKKWVGVDWDDGAGKHDGCYNGVRYFQASGPKTASFVQPHNLSAGITLLQALELRYRSASTKEEEEEMYVLSTTNKKVSIELLGKDKLQNRLSRFEELTSASLSYLGVKSSGAKGHIGLKELDLTGNLLSQWEDVGIICKELPAIAVLNLSNNMMSHDITGMPQLGNLRVLVLNFTGIEWEQVEMLKLSVPLLEELHLTGNRLAVIKPVCSVAVQGFDFLRILNLENNAIAAWDEVLKLSQLSSLEHLLLNNNSLTHIWYPKSETSLEATDGHEEETNIFKAFGNLRTLLLGGNRISDAASIDSLNSFPKLTDVRLSENPITDPGKSGLPRYHLIARLAKIQILNGSEISRRERRDSEIRYVRFVMSKYTSSEEIKQLHPRFAELKQLHGIEDEKATAGVVGPTKLVSGLISVTLKYVGTSVGEKPLMKTKLPSTTTVGKLKNVCESFFKLKSIKAKLYLQEEGTPLPTLLDDDMASLLDAGVMNESTILIDEES